MQSSTRERGQRAPVGEANFIETEGSKPMSIKWELNEPMPNYLWKESAKMSVG
jgi:hypothetical protein